MREETMHDDRRGRWAWVSTALILGVFLWAGSPAWGQNIFINEIHYDNRGRDADEGLEVAGPAGASMKGWSLVLYNGKNGTPYRTVPLEGTIPDQQGGYGTLSFPVNRIENGSPDGVALVNPEKEVVQFMSYEGGFTAVSGPAEGLAATDIGVRETNDTQADHSLQLRGSGNSLADFDWHGPGRATPGSVNADQTFVASPGETTGDGKSGSTPVEVVKEGR